MGAPVVSGTRALYLGAAGLACPIGLRRAPALAALRAGVTPFQRLDDGRIVSRLAAIRSGISRTRRMQALLRHAADEALGSLRIERGAALPTYVCLPEADSGASYDEAAVLDTLEDAAARARAELTLVSSVRSGRAGVFEAIDRALGRASTDGALALICAVDSLVDPQSLARLARRGWLLDAEHMDGRIVGEAAAALVVTTDVAHATPTKFAQLIGLAVGRDDECFESHMEGASINRASGLTRLFESLRGGLAQRAGAVVSAQPSEGYWGREFAFAYLRNEPMMPEPLYATSSSTLLGDAGAAGGAIALQLAIDELRACPLTRRRARPSALVYGVSDKGTLGGCTLTSLSS